MKKLALHKLQDDALKRSIANARALPTERSAGSCQEVAALYYFMAYWTAKKEQFPELWSAGVDPDSGVGDVKVFAENLGFQITQGSDSGRRRVSRDISIPASFSSNEVKVATAKAVVRKLLQPYLLNDGGGGASDEPEKVDVIMKASAAALLLSHSGGEVEINLHERLPKPYMSKWISCWEEGRNFEPSRLEEAH